MSSVFAPDGTRPIVFGGSAGKHLSQEVCQILGIEEGLLEVQSFSDLETHVKVLNNVRGADTYIIQSTCSPVNDNLMELLLTIDALRRASAERINVINPYYGYARQDRKDQGRVALSAKLVANLLVAAGAHRVVCLDLHSAQIQGFFDIPVDHLVASKVFVKYIKAKGLDKDIVVVSPDVGNVKRARNYAAMLDAPLVIIDKRRPKANVSEVMNIIGDVEGQRCFMFDDMIDTAGTLCNGADALIKAGAQSVIACATHAVLSGPAVERLRNAPIEQLIVTNSIMRDGDAIGLKKLDVVSIAPLLADTIKRIHLRESVSQLFD